MDNSVHAAFASALEWWEAMGVETPPVSTAKPKVRTAKAKAPQSTVTRTQSAQAKPPSTSDKERMATAKKLASAAKDLSALKSAMGSFDAGTLSDNASQCVFSRGNPQARLMIIGEAPGRDEDIAGEPFTGRTGKFLDRMLAAIGLTDKDFYITNIVNWHPPGGRKPTDDEIDMCRPFLMKHIELAAPDVILIAGGVSLGAMTDLNGIMKNRGTWQTLDVNGRDIPAIPMYHPAFLLRRPELKKEAWRDLLSLHERHAQTD
ncbi:MAG: uracil-DNA glycosylase [Maricaulaceae bacterium]